MFTSGCKIRILKESVGFFQKNSINCKKYFEINLSRCFQFDPVEWLFE